jgi:arylsulfatase A-like enzyme
MSTELWTELWSARFLALAAIVLWGCGSGERDRPSDVLLITLDTLRADYIHAYGFAGAITPNIDALAERGALFETAVAASSRTAPSHASIMTSLFARQHSVGTQNGSSALTGHETLAERFRAAGYRTGAFVSNFVLKRRTGLDRGFEHYDDELLDHEVRRLGLSERVAEDTVGRALAWLGGLRTTPSTADRSVFLWVHLQDPHGPYQPPSRDESRVLPVAVDPDPELPVLARDSGRMGIPRYQALAGMRHPSEYATRYAEEIAYVDQWVGALLSTFHSLSGEGAIVLLTADHGESLGEAGYYFQHGQFTSPPQAMVPFIVAAPGIAPQRHVAPVSHVDIAPTLLQLADLSPLPAASGISLVALMRDNDAPAERTLYSETKRELTAYRGRDELRVRAGPPLPGSRTNENPLRPDAELRWRAFQRSPHSTERQDLSMSDARAVALQSEVQAYLMKRVPTAPAQALRPDDIDRLRALGYLPND